MINVLFLADFPIEKSGIFSTASSILRVGVLDPVSIYSETHFSINGNSSKRLQDLGDQVVNLVFTHTECSRLPEFQKRYPDALFHVGDWPLKHWKSLLRIRPAKGTLAYLRCLWRLRKINRSTKLVFVSQEDFVSATSYGFLRALYLPIGVNPPELNIADQIDFQSICFSGNFRYQPNRDAAKRLLILANSKLPTLNVIFVGFYADDFREEVGSNVEIYSDVPSVVNFLAIRRPIYISLINTGSGAKNKILEAMVAGCPIICTQQSLDSSIPKASTIREVFSEEEVVSLIREWGSPNIQTSLILETNKISEHARTSRSWKFVAEKILTLITSN